MALAAQWFSVSVNAPAVRVVQPTASTAAASHFTKRCFITVPFCQKKSSKF